MGETMEEGKLVTWLVEPGEAFKRGQDILEVETDKTIVEFPALGAGTLVETLVDVGDTVPVGTPIARIDVGDGSDWTDDGAEEGGDADARPEPEKKEPKPEPAEVADPAGAGAGEAPPAGAPARIRATPVARRIARHRGIDLRSLSGSGRRGRIEGRDVEAALAAPEKSRQVAGVAYLEKGDATGTPVVFLHGFGADRMAWGGVQSRLSQVGRRTLSLDLPGHGATAHEARSAEDLHGPLDAAMTWLDLGPAHLVAHSMGAIPAVRLARARTVRSLTLIAPAGLGLAIDGEFLRGLAAAESPGEVSHLLDRITEGPHGLSSAILAQIHAELSQRRLMELAGALLGSSGQSVSIRSELAELAGRIPVHMILGHRDRILDWREMLDVSPRIAIHHLPRAGHAPHWDALADAAAILTEITK